MKLKEQIRPEGGAQPWIKTTETETLLIDIDLISFHFGPCTDPSHQNMTRLSILVQSRGRGTAFFMKMIHDGNHVSKNVLVSKHTPLVNILNFHYFTWDKTGICSSWKIYVWNDSLSTVGAPKLKYNDNIFWRWIILFGLRLNWMTYCKIWLC